jgi:hypothetical protein
MVRMDVISELIFSQVRFKSFLPSPTIETQESRVVYILLHVVFLPFTSWVFWHLQSGIQNQYFHLDSADQ